MCREKCMSGPGKKATWFDSVNDMGKDIAYHARDEYDTFLEKCLEPYGINKLNAAYDAHRVRIEEENPHIDGFETVSYQRFYIDDRYAFTVVFKQKPMNWNEIDTGLLFSYKKVIEQDLTPKKINMTNKEAAEILETVRGMSTTSNEDEAFSKAIAALEEQDKYQWIFAGVGDPEWDNLFEEVEKALGFKLFYWQKTYVIRTALRRCGSTTAYILRDLLFDIGATPIDYTKPTSDKRNKFYRDELFKIKEKLDKAGIKTREVWLCKAEKDARYKRRAEHIPASAGTTLPPNAVRNYCGMFDKGE